MRMHTRRNASTSPVLGKEVPACRFGARRRNGNFLPLWILTEPGLTYGRQFARPRVDPPAIRWTTRENVGKLEVTEGQDRIPRCLTCRQTLPRHIDNEEIVSDFVLQPCAGDRRCHCLPDRARVSPSSSLYKFFCKLAAQGDVFEGN